MEATTTAENKVIKNKVAESDSSDVKNKEASQTAKPVNIPSTTPTPKEVTKKDKVGSKKPIKKFSINKNQEWALLANGFINATNQFKEGTMKNVAAEVSLEEVWASMLKLKAMQPYVAKGEKGTHRYTLKDILQKDTLKRFRAFALTYGYEYNPRNRKLRRVFNTEDEFEFERAKELVQHKKRKRENVEKTVEEKAKEKEEKKKEREKKKGTKGSEGTSTPVTA